MTRTVRRLAIGLLILALLTPLGLWLPQLYKAGSAWGEWSSGELKKTFGYAPKGLKALENIWTKSVFSRYGVSGWTGPFLTTLGYILSALFGIAVIAGLCFLLGKVFISKEDGNGGSRDTVEEVEKVGDR